MKTTLLAAAALVALVGCGGPECEPADRLEVVGAAAPADADLVLSVAQSHCDRPIVGVFEWRTSGEHTGPAGTGVNVGRCRWAGGGCPMDAWATVPYGEHEQDWYMAVEGGDCLVEPLRSSAICSAMAHEIGHWCLRSEDEGAVRSWADSVNAGAVLRLAQGGL